MDEWERSCLRPFLGSEVWIGGLVSRLVPRASSPRQGALCLEEIRVNAAPAEFDHLWVYLSPTARQRLEERAPRPAGRHVRLLGTVTPYRRNNGSIDLGIEEARELDVWVGGEWVRVAKTAHPKLGDAERRQNQRMIEWALTEARRAEQLPLVEQLIASGERSLAARAVLERWARGESITDGQEQLIRRLLTRAGAVAQAAD